ncbi:DUF417 family protein [Pantoea sp. GM01]|uniref:DUF417 family protein n=1 Tax=Pantoea sp. GM01 TaxID=1144320 RepID=UPI000270F0CB|nr:DUF417 family protein [Pantoea sp. GM01]EJL91539.1 putative membrane protein [Pantoea sp. GM01]
MNIRTYLSNKKPQSSTLIRITLIIAFIISGNLKWFSPEMMLVNTLTYDSWLSFLPDYLGENGSSYLLAVVNAFIGITLLSGFIFPYAGIVGAVAVMMSSIIMLSISSYPIDSITFSLIIKETVLFGSGFSLLVHDVHARKNKPSSSGLIHRTSYVQDNFLHR